MRRTDTDLTPERFSSFALGFPVPHGAFIHG